jgi:hypothetical protein
MEKQKIRLFNVRISEGLYQTFREKLEERGMKMRFVVGKLLEKWISDEVEL